jgi:hypothetical protein
LLLIDLTTPRPFKDQTCTVTVAEFPDLAYDSLVAYWDAVVLTRTEADALVWGYAQLKTPVAKPLLDRIIRGIPASTAKPRVQRFVGARCCP